MKRTLASILSLLMLLPTLAACSDEPADTSETEAYVAESTTTADTTPAETDRSQIKDNLPDNLDFEGRIFRIVQRDDGADLTIEVDCEQTGDVIDEAIFARNLAVKERLNVEIETIKKTNTIHDANMVNDAIRTSVTAGSDDYDMAYNHMYGTMPLGLEGMFINVYDIPHIDFDQPWWSKSFLDEATLYGNCFAAAGDMSLTLIQSMYLIFVNKTLYGDYFDGDVYDIVWDGKWTLDKMAEMGRTVYKDVNGDSRYDVGDVYGYSTTAIRLLDALLFGSDIDLTARDNDNLPYFTIEGNERLFSFIDKASNILKDETLTWHVADSAQGEVDMLKKFTEGTILFIPYTAMGASTLRDMEDDFGVVPTPKFDEAQEDYSCCAHDGFSAVFVLTTCPDIEAAGAFMEAMCSESYRYVTPTYYETALKVKYSRDDATSQMLDMIRDRIEFSFAMIYGSGLNNAGTQFRNLIKGESDAVASTLASNMVTCEAKLADLLTKYSEME